MNKRKRQNREIWDSFSVYLCSAFGNFLSKFSVPYLALPFNIIAVCTFLTLQPHSIDDDEGRFQKH